MNKLLILIISTIILSIIVVFVFIVMNKQSTIPSVTATRGPSLTGVGYNILNGPVEKPT